jgi:hypothetical protein
VTQPSKLAAKAISLAVASLFLLSPMHPELRAQEKHSPRTAGVDDTKMGPDRALTQLAVAASQKGDNATAAELARILERTWDKATTVATRRCRKPIAPCSIKLTKPWISSSRS